jgi:hypothetical protein
MQEFVNKESRKTPDLRYIDTKLQMEDTAW